MKDFCSNDMAWNPSYVYVCVFFFSVFIYNKWIQLVTGDSFFSLGWSSENFVLSPFYKWLLVNLWQIFQKISLNSLIIIIQVREMQRSRWSIIKVQIYDHIFFINSINLHKTYRNNNILYFGWMTVRLYRISTSVSLSFFMCIWINRKKEIWWHSIRYHTIVSFP